MRQVVRIIGGIYRGKKLSFPDVPNLRPTPDRVKETLFNWLMNDIRGSRCLDAFAGSGALGFEAASRGASEVVMVEQSTEAFNYLKKNSLVFKSSQIQLIKGDTHHFLSKFDAPFDIIFLDPPFKENLLPDLIKAIEQHQLLSPDGLLYIESPNEVVLDAETWSRLKFKQSGQITYALYKKTN